MCGRGRVKDPKPLDYPLRADPDVLREQPLQGPQTHPAVVGQLLGAHDVVTSFGDGDQSRNLSTDWILLGVGLEQVRLEGIDHLADIRGCKDPHSRRAIIIAKGILAGLNGARDRSNTPLQQRMETAGMKGGAERVAGAGQGSIEPFTSDTVDKQPPFLGGDMHSWLWNDLLPVRP